MPLDQLVEGLPGLLEGAQPFGALALFAGLRLLVLDRAQVLRRFRDAGREGLLLLSLDLALAEVLLLLAQILELLAGLLDRLELLGLAVAALGLLLEVLLLLLEVLDLLDRLLEALDLLVEVVDAASARLVEDAQQLDEVLADLTGLLAPRDQVLPLEVGNDLAHVLLDQALAHGLVGRLELGRLLRLTHLQLLAQLGHLLVQPLEGVEQVALLVRELISARSRAARLGGLGLLCPRRGSEGRDAAPGQGASPQESGSKAQCASLHAVPPALGPVTGPTGLRDSAGSPRVPRGGGAKPQRFFSAAARFAPSITLSSPLSRSRTS